MLNVPPRYLQGCKPDTNRLTERAAAATQAWFYLQNPSAILLCTGYASQAGKHAERHCYCKPGRASYIAFCAAGLPAEANLLAAQARSLGVPHDCIVIEDQAQNSIENALNSLPILQSSKIQQIILVTSDYHMPRCRLLFEAVLQGTTIDVCWAEVSAAMSIIKPELQPWSNKSHGPELLVCSISRTVLHQSSMTFLLASVSWLQSPGAVISPRTLA